MSARKGLVAVAALVACGCAQTIPAPASPAPSAAAVPSHAAGAPPAATATPTRTTEPITEAPAPAVPDEVRWRERWKVCPPGQALAEAQNRALDYFHESPFSVIRVAPGDTLNLRSSSSPDAASLAKLDFQQTGMRWTGNACNVRGALWFEVEWSGLRGWVNGFYAQPTSKPRNETERVKPWLGTAKPKSFSQFVEQLRRGVGRQKALADTTDLPPCTVKTVGSALEASRARIVLFVRLWRRRLDRWLAAARDGYARLRRLEHRERRMARSVLARRWRVLHLAGLRWRSTFDRFFAEPFPMGSTTTWSSLRDAEAALTATLVFPRTLALLCASVRRAGGGSRIFGARAVSRARKRD